MSVVIRKIEVDDAQAWLECRLEALRAAPTAFSSSFEAESKISVDDIKKRITIFASSKSAMFGAFVDGALAGTVSLYHHDKLKELHKMDLWGVYVRPQFRGQKISRKLTEYAIEHARSVGGVEVINLAVETGNKEAAALYRSLGFRSWGIERKALKIDGSYYDLDNMGLEL